MAVFEAWLFFRESNSARQKAEMLEKELAQIRFEILKSQINPHFMFNSLNVLSGLIEKDVSGAQLFIDEFSRIYRYVLETIEKQVVTLEEELNFVRSYSYLQQIRYGGSLNVSVNIPAELLKMLLPPLSLQTVLENSIKHNIISKTNPLQVEITSERQWLIVINNLQPKISSGRSTGLGQKNLIKRYEMISDNIPGFIVQSNKYIVKLPLLSV
jgi:LytS/YehU family sensor histidine kinase